ncbi:hypothetical protein ACN38_g5073 [Penicillium nordicum]|uniref:Uncharacterized protein n=1 Tax=Penicillium nordicum TaxID=229535 RepID=A0A0M8PAC1_9EURO|nr:hypothetical protein ACN38_g5073 [Penicillium nordicum]
MSSLVQGHANLLYLSSGRASDIVTLNPWMDTTSQGRANEKGTKESSYQYRLEPTTHSEKKTHINPSP